jgi:hypothetical protein
MDENGTVRAAMTDALRTDRAPALALVGAVGLAALSAVLVLVATRHGPGTSPDSVEYVASARNLFEGRGFTSAGGDTLTAWPPGLPAVLALGLHVGIEPSTTARVVNAAAMAAIVLLTFVLLRRHVRSARAGLIGTALVALSPTLLRTADMIWSEPLFCALLLAFVVLAEDLMRNPARGTALLVAAAVLVWAASLVRWVGIALIPAGMVATYLGRPREGRVRRVVAFGALAAVVPALWLIRNVTTGNSLAGRRPTVHRSPTDTIRTLLLGIGRVVVPDGAPNALTELAGLIVIVAFVGGAVFAWRSGNSGRSRWPMTPLVSVVGFSLALLLGSYLFNGTDWSARILAPVYAPLVVIGFALFERARDRERASGRDWLATVVTGAFLVWFVFVVFWAAGLVWDHGRAARGYAAPVWRNSELVRAAGHVEPGAVLYTNVPLSVVAVTNRYPVLDARALRAGCTGQPVLAVYGNSLRGLDQLGVTRIRRVSDGTIYRVDCAR